MPDMIWCILGINKSMAALAASTAVTITTTTTASTATFDFGLSGIVSDRSQSSCMLGWISQ